MAKVQDLIAKCDESEMFTQNLQDNIVKMEVKGKSGEITFLTNPQFVFDELKGTTKKIGVVIWFPADVFER